VYCNKERYINPLTFIFTLAFDGWVVTFGTGKRAPPSPLLAVRSVTAHCQSINGQCTNFIFHVALQLHKGSRVLFCCISRDCFEGPHNLYDVEKSFMRNLCNLTSVMSASRCYGYVLEVSSRRRVLQQ